MPDFAAAVAAALGERYPIERELGRGGMAVIYLARDVKHGRAVALKVLVPELAEALGAERFLREIRLAAGLTHPHILSVHDSGKVDGILYYVMPYIEGESLRSRLTREQRLPLLEVMRIGREVADALDYAHARGVIHRDIKPENILLGAGHAIVADFGIARALSAAGVAEMTATGSIVGTPLYMSPEQASGKRDVDGRTDVYSLGCVLFEAIAGRPPFTGSTVQEVLVRRFVDDAPRLRSLDATIPLAIDAAVARALATEPEDRYTTAAELSMALHLASDPGPATPPGGTTDVARHRTAEASIAVLPFTNMSSDREAEYFSDGMTEEIINALSQVRGLRVAARTSCFAFKGQSVDAREIGERLRVRTLLEGSVRRAGDRVRITAQLVNAADGYHLWSQTYERTLADVFAVQDELARAIARTLTRTVAGTTSGPLVTPQTENLEAYTIYLQGRHAWALASLEGYQAATQCYEQAIALDPDYAQAHAWLAYAYAMLGFDEFGLAPVQEMMPKAKAAAIRAIELDPTLGDAHFGRAVVAALYDWDWGLAQSEFELAMSLSTTSALAGHWYAVFLCAMGHVEQAMQAIRHAQLLDPLSVTVQVSVGRCLYYERRYDDADRVFRDHLRLNPGSIQGYVSLIRNCIARGAFAEAMTAAEQGINQIGRVPLLLSLAGQAHGWQRRRGSAEALIAELRQLATRRYVPPLYEAMIYVGLGDRDTALTLYERAYEQRAGWLTFLRAEPTYDCLRAEPRFINLIKRMRLDY